MPLIYFFNRQVKRVELSKTRINAPKNPPRKEIALFWDYENVPVPRKGGEVFLQALQRFFTSNPLKYGRIYVHKEILPADILGKIRKLGAFKVKWVTVDGANAADKVMIQSARDLVRTHIQLSILIFITGDGHFKTLLRETGAPGANKILICGRGNYNWRLFEEASHICSTRYLMNHPEDWWEAPTQRRLVINRKEHPLIFCAVCENLLNIRWNGTHYLSWCPVCNYRLERAQTNEVGFQEQMERSAGRFIAL